MAAVTLRCVAIAYRAYEMEKVPKGEEQLTQWALPEDDLVLLAIVGIKVSVLRLLNSLLEICVDVTY